MPVADAFPLINAVRVRPRFLRSVHLERDFYADAPLDGYVPTPTALSALSRVARGITHPTDRAFSITGPYGTGKSAWALLLTKTLSVAPVGDASVRARIAPLVEGVSGAFAGENAGAGFWPVLVTGGREAVSDALMRGLFASLSHLPADLQTGASEALQTALGNNAPVTAQTVTRAYEAAAAFVKTHLPDGLGLLVVVDEMGKFLEWAGHHAQQGDVQVLQEMAEAAVRSQNAPLVFVTILHQAFDEYAHRLGPLQRTEWQKVQGRFADVPFGDASEETVRLVARAVTQADDVPGKIASRIDDAVRRESDACFALGLLPRSLPADDFYDLARQAYPLHPLTLLVLPPAFKRFGQSERSLFSFLASEEPFGFLAFLRGHFIGGDESEPVPFLRVSDVYDYLLATLGASLYRSGGQGASVGGAAKLWSETQEALARCENRAPLDARLIKTVGLLHILGETATRTPASREVLQLSASDVGQNEVSDALNRLQTATLITYRQFKRTFRPYEGSDIDVEARLREARQEFAPGVDAAETAQKLAALMPLVARRHLFETGTLRYFEAAICRPDTLEFWAALPQTDGENNVPREKGADGLLLLCLAASTTDYEFGLLEIARLFSHRAEVIVGLAPETDALHEAAVGVECLLWIQNNTPELQRDSVAQREVAERLADAETAFLGEWETLLRPAQTSGDNFAPDGGPKTAWFYQNAPAPITGGRDLQTLVSRACASAYPNTPRLLNELLNRRQISSTAASARRILLENMLEFRHKPLLGMDANAFPPERSMYAAVLEETGLHRATGTADETGTPLWDIFPPLPGRDAALDAVWGEMEAFLFEAASADDLSAKPLPDLLTRLQSAPFGLPAGVVPVLLCAALLYFEAEVILYENEAFVTLLDGATLERLMKRPEQFRLRGVRVAGERQAVLERFGRGLLGPSEPATLVTVVRALYRLIARLPAYTMKTRDLSPSARALRDLFRQARGPEQLLFVDLPRLLQQEPFGEAGANDAAETSARMEAFFAAFNPCLQEVVGAYDALLGRVEQVLLEQFGVETADELIARAEKVRRYVSESRLFAFVQRACDTSLSPRKWLESLAAVVVGKPPFAWTNVEEARWENELTPLFSAFVHSELVAFDKTDKADAADAAEEAFWGFRVAITQDGGAEDARVVVMPRKDEVLVEEKTQKILEVFNEIMADMTTSPAAFHQYTKRIPTVYRARENFLFV